MIDPTGSTTAAHRLAGASAQTSYAGSPEVVRERVIDVFVDTLAVMAAGSARGQHRRLQQMLGTPGGGATVIGSSIPTSAMAAVVVNGTTPTVLQMDEGHRVARGHPAIHIVPAVLALAEERRLSTEAMLSAVIVGYEVATRIGLALGPLRPEIHPHGNWGTIGAAAAVAHLLTRDVEIIARAVDAAAAVALFPDRAATAYGAGVHHLYPALGAQTGLVVGTAAAAGFTAVPGRLEHYFGPQSAINFDPRALDFGIEPATGKWSRYEILNGYIKFVPACAHTHTALGALETARRRHGFTATQIQKVSVTAFGAAAALGQTRPRNDLAARFSIPMVLAAALQDGEFTADTLNEDYRPSAPLVDLAERITVAHEPAFDAKYPQRGRPVEVVITLTDGRVISERASYSFGDVEQPASREDIHAKALDLLSQRFGLRHGSYVLEKALDLETGGSLAELSQALRTAATPATSAASQVIRGD